MPVQASAIADTLLGDPPFGFWAPTGNKEIYGRLLTEIKQRNDDGCS